MPKRLFEGRGGGWGTSVLQYSAVPKLFVREADAKDGAIIAPTLGHVLEAMWLLAHLLKGGEKSFGCDSSWEV